MRTMLKVLCIVAFLCASASVEGQNYWVSLNGLKTGQKIQIIEMNSKKHTGTFLSASETAITFREHSAEKSLEKTDVRSVKLNSHRRMRNTLIGFGAGVGAGTALGAAVCHDPYGLDGLCVAGGALVGALVGVPIGVVMPTQNTVYNVNSH